VEVEVVEVVLVEDEVGDGGNVAATVGMVRWILINRLTVLLPIFSPSCYLI
jgi:hypothetical protein